MYQLYRFYDKDERLLYAGISITTLRRLVQHRQREWYESVVKATFENFPSRSTALNAERYAIIKESPSYNIQHSNSDEIVEFEGEIIIRDIPPPMALAKEGFITKRQLANELAISEQLIIEWEKIELPVYTIGKIKLYDVKEVAAWIRKVGK